MKLNSYGKWWTLALFLTLPALALTLMAQQTNSLVISGQQGQANVVQVQGRNYVEVEGLARILNGTIGFNGNQIILTLAGSDGDAPSEPAPASGFSKGFQTAGIEAMTVIREWHAALKNGIEQGLPLSEQWLGPYRAQAREAVRLASVAISTDSDKNVYPFVVNEFNNMKTLTDKYLQMTKSMNYIDPSSLRTDPVDQKILTCARSLASMATTNQFADDGSCQ